MSIFAINAFKVRLGAVSLSVTIPRTFETLDLGWLFTFIFKVVITEAVITRTEFNKYFKFQIFRRKCLLQYLQSIADSPGCHFPFLETDLKQS